MKLKQTITLTVTVGLVALLITSGYATITVSGQETEQLPFADFYMIGDGTFDPNLSPANLVDEYGITIPNDVLHSTNPWRFDIQDEVKILSDGSRIKINSIYSDGTDIRVGFSIVLKAPLIDIWDDDPGSSYDGINLSETDLEPNPTDGAQSELSWSLSRMMGSLDYQYENLTDISTDQWNYNTSFLLSSYDILILDNLESKGNSGNVSITVSYSNSSTVTDYTSSQVHNETIYNDFINLEEEIWFRLDLENSNNSYSQYVNLIEINNFDADGRYIADATANISDTRYTKSYLGDRGTFIDLNSNFEDKDLVEFNPSSDSEYSTISLQRSPEAYGLDLTGFFPEAFLSLPSQLEDSCPPISCTRREPVISESRGWDSSTDLENAVKDSIINKDPNDSYENRDQIDDISMDNLVGNWDIPQKIREDVKEGLDRYQESESTVRDVLDKTKAEVTERVSFATDLKADVIKNSGDTADDALDNTNSLYAAVQGKDSAFGQDIWSKVTDATGRIKEGAISVWTNIKKTIEDAGLNVPLVLIGFGFLALIVILFLFNRVGLMSFAD